MRPFIAELHDIGKLVDWSSSDLRRINHTGHILHNIDFSQLGVLQPTSPSW